MRVIFVRAPILDWLRWVEIVPIYGYNPAKFGMIKFVCH
jgi:hypothetical protein